MFVWASPRSEGELLDRAGPRLSERLQGVPSDVLVRICGELEQGGFALLSRRLLSELRRELPDPLKKGKTVPWQEVFIRPATQPPKGKEKPADADKRRTAPPMMAVAKA